MRGLRFRSGAVLAFGFGACWLCATSAQTAARQTGTADSKVIVVTLRAGAVVDVPVVTVGAVAAVHGGETWLREMIGSLDVAELSSVGKTVAVSREQVAMRIQIAGVDALQFRVDGPAEVMVKMSAVELTEMEVVKAARQALVQCLKADPKDVDIRLLEAVHVPAVDIAAGDQVRLTVDTPLSALTTGKVRVAVGILVNGQRRGAAIVALEVAQYRQVAVATRRIEAGEALEAAYVRPERRPVGPNDKWLTYTEQLLGKRVMHTVPAGQTLTGGDLDVPAAEDEVLIHTRDNVKLVANAGNLCISATGEAQQEGKLGQMIRVRNIDSGKIVVGRVMDRTTVEVGY